MNKPRVVGFLVEAFVKKCVHMHIQDSVMCISEVLLDEILLQNLYLPSGSGMSYFHYIAWI